MSEPNGYFFYIQVIYNRLNYNLFKIKNFTDCKRDTTKKNRVFG